MGLLDFLRGKREPDLKTERASEIGGVKITSTVKVSRGGEARPKRDFDDRREVPYEPTPLRAQKTYDENVPVPCGFDFSAVRRARGSKTEWWLEGGNFAKAMGALAQIRPFEDKLRDERGWGQQAVAEIMGAAVPYEKGANSALVPTVSKYTADPYGDGIEVRFCVQRTNKDYHRSVSIRFNSDGSIAHASVTAANTYLQDTWFFTVENLGGSLRLGTVTHR